MKAKVAPALLLLLLSSCSRGQIDFAGATDTEIEPAIGPDVSVEPPLIQPDANAANNPVPLDAPEELSASEDVAPPDEVSPPAEAGPPVEVTPPETDPEPEDVPFPFVGNPLPPELVTVGGDAGPPKACDESNFQECPFRICDLVNNLCIQCIAARHCPQGAFCRVETRRCVRGCRDAGDCWPEKPVCDATREVCVECTESSHCSQQGLSAACVNNECRIQ